MHTCVEIRSHLMYFVMLRQQNKNTKDQFFKGPVFHAVQDPVHKLPVLVLTLSQSWSGVGCLLQTAGGHLEPLCLCLSSPFLSLGSLDVIIHQPVHFPTLHLEQFLMPVPQLLTPGSHGACTGLKGCNKRV